MPHTTEIDLLARYGYFAGARIERTLLGPREEFSLTLRPARAGRQWGEPLVLRCGGVSDYARLAEVLAGWAGQTLEAVRPVAGASEDLCLCMYLLKGAGSLDFSCKNLGVIDPFSQHL